MLRAQTFAPSNKAAAIFRCCGINFKISFSCDQRIDVRQRSQLPVVFSFLFFFMFKC